MKYIVKNLIEKICYPPTIFLVCVSVLFLFVFSFQDFAFLVEIFKNSEVFAFAGAISIMVLISRMVEIFGFSVKSIEWFESRRRLQKGWPTKKEEFLLESLFYEDITFDELYKFVHFAFDANYLAFTENSSATIQNYTLLARSDADKYWLSYFRFSHREQRRIKMLYLIISHFMEVLTGDSAYKKELMDQARNDPELKNIDIEKLLICILNKEEIKKYCYICEKYYKMTIEKKIDNKNLFT